MEPAGNQSATKTLAVIEYLAACDNEPQRLQDIATGLSMNASTVFRFLQALMDNGYVAQDSATSRYFLTTKICSVSHRVSSNIHLNDLALPIMKKLAADFNESVCLAIEQDMTVVYVGVVQGPDQMLRTMQRIGNSAPMHCTGVGKLLLLNHSEEELDEMIARRGLPQFTEHTITTKPALWAELEQVRRQGYAYDNEECEIGARCIAVPAYDYSGKIVAGLSVTGPIFRMADDKLASKLSCLLEAGNQLSAALGYGVQLA